MNRRIWNEGQTIQFPLNPKHSILIFDLFILILDSIVPFFIRSVSFLQQNVPFTVHRLFRWCSATLSFFLLVFIFTILCSHWMSCKVYDYIFETFNISDPPPIQTVSFLPDPPENSLTVNWSPINCDQTDPNNAYIHLYRITYCRLQSKACSGMKIMISKKWLWEIVCSNFN